jgi:energy-coupling factor transporter ATP-binding protein EcfA2/energy-coupling factor transporter transmembrane protein EcfT
VRSLRARKPGSRALSEQRRPTGSAGPSGRLGEPSGQLEVRGLTWRPFGRREPVIPGLDLDIPAGQRVLLVGPSGSGKSTLLRGLAGLLEVADSGERDGTVLIDGEIGLVLQEPGAGIVSATVGRDVAFGLENIGMPRADMPARVAAALAAVRLDMPQDTPTHALSGGEQQRLALAGALALEPTVLLLDEPTAMLDPLNAESVRRTVHEVTRARHLTTVVVEHRLGPWLDVVDRLVVLDSTGHITADGEPLAVLAEHGESLAAQGIWVPGYPDPQPRGIPDGLFVPSSTGANVLTLDAADVTISRSVRALDGSTRTTVAVQDQWFQARAGQVHALVGPSGAGKSTFMLALTGLLGRQSGEVRLRPDLAVEGERDPRELGTRDLARRVAWVPQWASSTIVSTTVLDEVMTTSRAVGLVESEALARAMGLLEHLGLTHLAQADPRHLSGGEQRRLAMASAVVHQPDLVCADEATVGQDRLTWAAVMGIVEGLRDAGSAIVLTTHDDAVITRADTVTTIDRPVQPPPEPARRRPLVARAGPLALMVGAFLAIPAGVVSPRWSTSLVVLGIQVILAAVGLWAPGAGLAPRGRLRGVLLRLVPGLVGSLSVAWSTWLLGGHDTDTAFTAGLRVLIIVLPSAVLIQHIDADALGDHLGQRLRLPSRPVVAVAAALQRVHTFGEIWSEIARARRVRGIGATMRSPRSVLAELWALTMGMLVRSLQAAAALAVAMDARGFASAQRRTWAEPVPWRRADVVLLLGASLPAVVAAVSPA